MSQPESYSEVLEEFLPDAGCSTGVLECGLGGVAYAIEETLPDAGRVRVSTRNRKRVVTSPGQIIEVVDILYIGTRFRIVALPNGAVMEVMGSDGVWHPQREMTEP